MLRNALKTANNQFESDRDPLGGVRVDSSMPRWDTQEFPEEPPVSLCIAATCRFDDKACVVHCCDTAGTRGDVKSEDVQKIRAIGACTSLLAGDMTQAKELFASCAPFIKKYPSGGDDLAITALRQGLVEAVRLRKRAISTAVLSAELGVTYDEVFNWSQSQPSPIWTEAWQRIKSLGLGAEIITSAFTDDEVAILVIQSDGSVAWTEHYAAVGTGSGIAAAFLHQLEYLDWMPLEECLYRVFEAKMAAEKNPYVGHETAIEICTPDARYRLSKEYGSKIMQHIDTKRKSRPNLPIEQRFLLPNNPE